MPSFPIRTEAESLARALELGLIDVADAVRWADQKIADSEVPDDTLCDVSMSSKAYPQDVAHLLRGIPGQCDRQLAFLHLLRCALDTLTSGRRTPECVARAMFQLAIAGDVVSTRFQDEAFCWDAMFDAVREGYVSNTRGEITGEMISTLSQTLADSGIHPITS
jgi:hypothetical protein